MVTALTSLFAIVSGVRYLRLNWRDLPAVLLVALECVGAAMVFVVLNVGLAGVVVVVTRTLGMKFVSAYIAGDVVWLVISMLQALCFQLWRANRTAS